MLRQRVLEVHLRLLNKDMHLSTTGQSLSTRRSARTPWKRWCRDYRGYSSLKSEGHQLCRHMRKMLKPLTADSFGNVIHLGERDCTIQRRNQKVLEEAPSIILSNKLREKMGIAAVNAAKAVNYINAGTIEFLLDKHGDFYRSNALS